MTPLMVLTAALLAAAPDEAALCSQVEPDGRAVVERAERDDGLRGVWACGYIAATTDSVYRTLRDYESYPGWMDKVGATEVEWPSPATAVVSYRLDIPWGEFNYTLVRTHAGGKHISWEMSEGDWDAVEGYYHLRPTPEGHTLLFMGQFIDPGRYVPGFIERYFQRRGSRRLLQDIRDETLRRQAEAPPIRVSGPEAQAAPEAGADQ